MVTMGDTMFDAETKSRKRMKTTIDVVCNAHTPDNGRAFVQRFEDKCDKDQDPSEWERMDAIKTERNEAAREEKCELKRCENG